MVTHRFSVEYIAPKENLKDSNFINQQIQKIPSNTIVIFTDGSSQNNPGPTGAGAVIFKDGMNKPPLKFANPVSKHSTN